MATYLSAFIAIGGLWETIATELLSSKPSWDFESKKAPNGPRAKIVDIEIAALFVTAARRALKNDRIFERASITLDYLNAALKPHRKTFHDLVGVTTRKNAINRTNKSIIDDMEALVFFELFETIEDRKTWRLTDLGISCYERFNQHVEGTDPVPPTGLRDIPAVSYSGFGSISGWLGRELTIHYRSE